MFLQGCICSEYTVLVCFFFSISVKSRSKKRATHCIRVCLDLEVVLNHNDVSSVQYSATCCNMLQLDSQLVYNNDDVLGRESATYRNIMQHTATYCKILQHTARYCNTIETYCNEAGISFARMMCRVCNTLQHTATRCNTLQHTAKHCN